jgi:hypothetical protein
MIPNPFSISGWEKIIPEGRPVWASAIRMGYYSVFVRMENRHCETPSGRGLFISLFHEKKRNEPKRKFAGCISEAKNRIIFPKTAKRASLGRGRFFTEK